VPEFTFSPRPQCGGARQPMAGLAVNLAGPTHASRAWCGARGAVTVPARRKVAHPLTAHRRPVCGVLSSSSIVEGWPIHRAKLREEGRSGAANRRRACRAVLFAGGGEKLKYSWLVGCPGRRSDGGPRSGSCVPILRLG
jgi:hypothetical protein